MTAPPGLVVVGRVVKPHGLHGEVAVELHTDVAGRLDAGVEVALAGEPSRIVRSRPHQGRLLVVFEGVTDRTAAEALRGAEVAAPPLDPAELDVYLANELLGLPVRRGDGADLGAVVAFVELPAAAGYDLLEVRRGDEPPWLLPASDAYVEVATDADGDPVALAVVDPPAGLLPGDEQDP